MTIQEIDEALSELNAQVDKLKSQARVLVRNRDRLLAQAKIAAMPEAERAALLEMMKEG